MPSGFRSGVIAAGTHRWRSPTQVVVNRVWKVRPIGIVVSRPIQAARPLMMPTSGLLPQELDSPALSCQPMARGTTVASSSPPLSVRLLADG
jgi:hypothetical protein